MADQILHIKNCVPSPDEYYVRLLELVPLIFTKINYFKRSIFRYDSEFFGSIPVLDELGLMVTTQFNKNLHGIFCNFYEDGTDYAPYHRDNYGCNTLVTLSFGGERDFYMKADNGSGTLKFVLSHGDLFMFPNSMNATHKHSIPQRLREKNNRMSILFFLN